MFQKKKKSVCLISEFVGWSIPDAQTYVHRHRKSDYYYFFTIRWQPKERESRRWGKNLKCNTAGVFVKHLLTAGTRGIINIYLLQRNKELRGYHYRAVTQHQVGVSGRIMRGVMMNNVMTLFKSNALTGRVCVCVCGLLGECECVCQTGITTCQATHRERRDWEIIWIKVWEVKHFVVRLSAVNHTEDRCA